LVRTRGAKVEVRLKLFEKKAKMAQGASLEPFLLSGF
jgi:hypothetical protein